MTKILLVDDASFMRMMVGNIVKKAGYEVVGEAPNGLEGVKKYKELSPDLVFMDITMPVMNGIEAVKEIKKINPSAKIIMCSAMGQKTMVVDAIKAGASNFIVKPFQEDKLLEVIQSVLK